MSSRKSNVTAYLVLKRHKRNYRGKVTVTRVTQKKPTLEPGEVAVKVNISVPLDVFDATLTANLFVEDKDIIQPVLDMEVVE